MLLVGYLKKAINSFQHSSMSNQRTIKTTHFYFLSETLVILEQIQSDLFAESTAGNQKPDFSFASP